MYIFQNFSPYASSFLPSFLLFFFFVGINAIIVNVQFCTLLFSLPWFQVHLPHCNIIANLSNINNNNNESIDCISCCGTDIVSGPLHQVSHLIFPVWKVVAISSILQIENLRLRGHKQLVNNNQLMETILAPLISIFTFLLFYHASSHYFKWLSQYLLFCVDGS